MDINEAIDIIFNINESKEAFDVIENNIPQITSYLILKLKKIIEKKEIEEIEEFHMILHLILKFRIIETFDFLLEILEFINFRVNIQLFIMTLSKIIHSYEKNIDKLNNYIFSQTNPLSQHIVYKAIILSYEENKELQKINDFLREIVNYFVNTNFEYFKYEVFLLEIINDNIYFKNYQLIDNKNKLEKLIEKIIIFSEIGYKSENFEKYFCLLYKINPKKFNKIIEIENYINNIKNEVFDQVEIGLFKKNNNVKKGKLLFKKINKKIENSNDNLIKITLKKMRKYDFNSRKIPHTKEEYYEEIYNCFDLTGNLVDRYVLVNEKFGEILKKYDILKKKIEELIDKVKEELNELKKSRYNRKGILEDIEVVKLKENYIKRRKLEVLFKNQENIESGLLIFYMKELETFFKNFSSNEKIKELSLFSQNQIDYRISYYNQIIRKFEFLLAEIPISTLNKIYYNIKFIPYYDNIQNIGRRNLKLSDEEYNNTIIEKINLKIENHPLNPINLEKYNKNEKDYLNILRKNSSTAIANIKHNISNSICLSKRKKIIEKIINGIENKDYEVVINILPIQIEGLFKDFLEYSLMYEYCQDIEVYNKIMNIDLVQKIDFGIKKNLNMFFDTIAYFKYYFNSLIRNNVAHGNYDFLVDNVKDIKSEIFALELLYDLNSIIHTISETNEIDTAQKYIEETFDRIKKSEKYNGSNEINMDCLINDLNGTRERFNLSKFKSGLFVSYEATRILYWIFNPLYEKYLDNNKLKSIRNLIISSQFFSYIKNRIRSNFENKELMKSMKIIKTSFELDNEMSLLITEIIKYLNS
ncbi:hypothetical protein [Leptotrichia buccalis]|uniref:Uncharacterized protein n=1 Tax=Leptotrichia buccalis (strain ATCC 14201 / DSM 1135 / JCM 12969 / NCTC 10249 / C-1013-b) TaxID=523794 RepID=C7NA20_LEPBD|nr:hypothetical protein [Leptotrichia buccalis]ACV39001.1 hypothetical protein Lebu_1104 [Leptotrichia buccalis C-1013-b]